MRRIVLISLAIASVVGAVFLGLLGTDVLAWRSHLDEADMRYQAVRGDEDMWEADTILPARLSRDAAGVGDDIEYREAVQLFRLSGLRSQERTEQQVQIKSAAEIRLDRVGRTNPSNEVRSAAANLRGAISFEEARATTEEPGIFLRRSLANFEEAIELDPASEDAKFNLELVLRLVVQTQEGEGGGSGGARSDTPASGAGSATSGSGY